MMTQKIRIIDVELVKGNTMRELIDLEEEERCGYMVVRKLKKIWNVELNMLVELLQVCEKHKLRVAVWSGTLLGAIRHKGFIPWDDDLDVAMPREDYEKLLKVAQYEFSEPLFLQTGSNDKRFFLPYARLRNSNTTGMILWNRSQHYNNGIYIDIYVLDGYIDNKLLFNIQYVKKTFLEQIIKVYYADNTYQSRKPKLIIYAMKRIAKRNGYESWLDRYNKVLTAYNGICKEVSLLTHEKDVAQRYHCTLKDFDEIVYVPYETIQVPVPKNFDAILKNFYGEYMKLPPKSERGKWHEDMIIFEPEIPYEEYIRRWSGK